MPFPFFPLRHTKERATKNHSARKKNGTKGGRRKEEDEEVFWVREWEAAEWKAQKMEIIFATDT